MAPSHPAGTARISLRKYCDVVRRALLCHARLHLRCAAILGLVLVAALPLAADTITGTVKDPSGAVVPGARIEISGGGLAQPIVLSTDDAGKQIWLRGNIRSALTRKSSTSCRLK